MNEGLRRIVEVLKRVTGSVPAPFVVTDGRHVMQYIVYSGLSEMRICRKTEGPDEFFERLDRYFLPVENDTEYDALDAEVVRAVEEIKARQEAEKARAADNNPQAARHVFWALYHLHIAGSLLTSRQHEYIDTIEYELCALVRSRPEDCAGCERRTPSVLLKEEGANGRCPFCRGEPSR